jgi:hypothetical protein
VITTKLLGYGLAGSLLISGGLGIALAVSNHRLSSAKEVILVLDRWQDGVIGSLRLASGNNEVTADTAQLQIAALGNSLVTLHSSLKQSNDAVDKLAEDAARAQALAQKEAQARAAAIKKADQLAAQLHAGAATSVAPEEIEAEIRRTQDELYEASL